MKGKSAKRVARDRATVPRPRRGSAIFIGVAAATIALLALAALSAFLAPSAHRHPPSSGPSRPTGTTGTNAAGRPEYRLDAASYFDSFGGEEAWLKAHVGSIKAYAPFGDRYVKYGLPVLSYHDPATEGFSPLTAASIERYVSKVKRDAGAGYAGPLVDDANWSVGFRDGTQSRSLEPEKHELADLIEAVRAAQPDASIEMNSQYRDIWRLMKAHDSDVERALRSVNVVTKEFGVGPTAGISTPTEYAEFFNYVDALHAKGVHLNMGTDYHHSEPSEWEYNLATYLMFNDGHDYFGVTQTPLNWWPGFSVNLGDATSPRKRSAAGVWTRAFSRGAVFTVEPGAPTQTIVLPRPMKTISGETVSAITMAASHGAVLHT
jgi:hypothetical protein